MTIFISLGNYCYIKSMIDSCGYSKETDIFDWCFSANLTHINDSFDNNFNIFDDMEEFLDHKKNKCLINHKYSLCFPHENEYFKLNNDPDIVATFNKNSLGAKEIISKYTRRYNRFINYKNDVSNNYVFIRNIHITNVHNFEPENIQQIYNKDNYNKLMKHLPKNSIIILLTTKKLSQKDVESVYEKFLLFDNIISTLHAFAPPNISNKDAFKKTIIQQYKLFLKYIDNNFLSIKNNHTDHITTLKSILNLSVLNKFNST